ncbi:phosphoribosyl-AMP cyclohydrolase [Streptomyces kebangsaanensis]|uniref:Phosphoribosyl-AMP cyclohydrolase n=1 Tax=Streptomyces kebangsaanensis TaxID=864058 RepID=A0ABW6KKR9_9ACTN
MTSTPGTPARHPTTAPHRGSPSAGHLGAPPSRHSAPASSLAPEIAARLKRSADGLLPAIAQQYDTGEVLMLGWMDDEALHRTLTTGRCTYWSRSRREYWVKGDTSGHVQYVKSVALDCDADTVLVKVDQVGAACHTGDRTCFDTDVLLEDVKDAGSGARAEGQ